MIHGCILGARGLTVAISPSIAAQKLDVDGNGELSREELQQGMANFTPLRKAPGFGNCTSDGLGLWALHNC